MSYGTNAPQGLQPISMLGNSTWNNQTEAALIASGYAQNIFMGSPVYAVNDGTIGLATAGDGNPIMGVFWGCNYILPGGQVIFSPYWAANTVVVSPGYPIATATAFIIVDPSVVYSIQTTDSTVAANHPQGAVTSDIYKNASLIAGGAPGGDPISGISNWSLDIATIGTGATKQLKIIGFQEIPGNIPGTVGATTVAGNLTPYNNVLVTINNHYHKGGTGTVGV